MRDIHGRQLDLNLIVAFDALVREGSVTRAADQLGITQSAMSHALRRLRDFFDDPLFVKSGDGMRPTPKAEQLSEAVLGVMATVRSELLAQAGFDAAKAQRTFSLCMTDIGELVFLPPIIEQLRRLAPHCRLRTLQLPLEQVAQALESGEADLALGSLHTVHPGLFQQELFTDTFVTLASTSNAAIGDSIDLAQFCRLQHVVVTLSGKSGPYDRALEDYGIKRDVFLTTSHFLVVPVLIEQHPDLIATVPSDLGRVLARHPGVKVLKPPVEIPPFALRQHWHPRYHHDEANVWLRRLIKATFDRYRRTTA